MYSLLLVIIYLSFISLGLPDSLLGSAWPVMRPEFGAEISFAGVISMIISFGTIVSSLLSDKLNRKLGTGVVTAVSVVTTAIALFGFSRADSLWAICLIAIPYGLGAGAVDAALNNYVALHYASRHMSWLHCFWGVGASISPYIMGASIANNGNWRGGYARVSYIQIALSIVLFLTLFLWKKKAGGNVGDNEVIPADIGIRGALKIKGVVCVLIAFFGYCALETTAGMWASSYFVEYRGTDPVVAARLASLFSLGITFGRFLSGFISDKAGDKRMIRIGISVATVGVVLIMLPLDTDIPALAGLLITGLGCAPVYPMIIHSTPFNFGRENSQAIVGIQMASAYIGSTFMAPLFGLVAGLTGIGIYPFYLVIFAVLMLVMTERLNSVVKHRADAVMPG